MVAEGNHKGKDGQVFVDTEGGFIRRSNLHRGNFQKIIKRANEQAKEDAAIEGVDPFNLPNIRIHDLRHTCATLLLLEGHNPKIVAERLGHSKIQTTLDTYSHVLPTMQAKAAQAMNSLFDKMAL
jgi:integrase